MIDEQATLTRLLARGEITFDHILLVPTPCMVWTGALDRDGYGKVSIKDADGVWRTKRVHRYVFELVVGPIPAGLELDHVCRHRACFNPEHLDPVPGPENTRRGCGRGARSRDTHCARGHEFTDENTATSVRASGTVKRECVTCRNDRRKA